MNDNYVVQGRHACRDVGLMRRSKIFAFNALYENVPAWKKRGICPTDIDHLVEMSGNFLFFEFKTDPGTRSREPHQLFHGNSTYSVSGQGKAFRALVGALGVKAMLVICYHKPLFSEDLPTGAYEVPEHVEVFLPSWVENNAFVTTHWFPGQKLPDFCEKWASYEYSIEHMVSWRENLLKSGNFSYASVDITGVAS